MKLVIAPRHNIEGKKDATGAFHPEAHAFARMHGADDVRLFDNGRAMPVRLAQVRRWIDEQQPRSVDTLALFCHGWKNGLQIGVRIATARSFAEALAAVCTPDLRVVLYCCDAARDADDERVDDTLPGPGGNGGFADKLRDELGRAGVQATIYAHATAGHTTRNPWVRRFDPGEVAGGHWIVEPHSANWIRWVRALRTDMRFRFPFLTQAQIEAELRGVDGVAE